MARRKVVNLHGSFLVKNKLAFAMVRYEVNHDSDKSITVGQLEYYRGQPVGKWLFNPREGYMLDEPILAELATKVKQLNGEEKKKHGKKKR